MNNKIILVVFVVSCLPPAQPVRDFKIWYQSYSGVIQRMTTIMRTIYVKVDERITGLHHIKFRYENSMQFEQGYLMGAIIEKYRRCVEHTKASEQLKAFKVYDLLLRLEIVELAYIDVYRLVNMMHEIPRKFGFDIRKRKRSTVKGNPKDLIIAIKTLKKKEINRSKQRRLRLKELKKVREMMQQAGNNLTMTPRKPRNMKQWWEFQEYGWELEDDYRPDW